MQTVLNPEYKTGIFKQELKNRFLCEVEIDGESTVCYVPSSCHLSNFLSLQGKKVILIPTMAKDARTQYAVYAVPYKRSYLILNTSMANRAIEASLRGRRFAYLGKRKNVIKEHYVDGYKSDLFIEDTNTIIEIKSVLSTDDEVSGGKVCVDIALISKIGVFIINILTNPVTDYGEIQDDIYAKVESKFKKQPFLFKRKKLIFDFQTITYCEGQMDEQAEYLLAKSNNDLMECIKIYEEPEEFSDDLYGKILSGIQEAYGINNHVPRTKNDTFGMEFLELH